ncbi:MAG: peptidoglycan-binding protein, partial [Candidatus Paceibacterota bacterium]
ANLTFAQAQAIKITYYDSTGGSWVEIPTVVTLSVPSATTIAGLDDDPAITLTGTTTHLSTYAPSIPTDSDAPPVPTGLSATASDVSAVLSWTASAGATKYDIYKKVGADYPYLAQTTSTSYTATGLTNGTIYYFKVSALDSSSPNKESAATTEVSVTPVAPSGSGRHGSSTASATSAVSTVTPAGTAVPATPVVGCSGGNLFNTQTGAACVNNAVIPQGCSGGNLFNTSTGAACPVSATPATPATPAVPGVSSATPATPATPASYNFGISTLKNGSKGEGVKELQRFLNVKLNLGLVIDGKLGPKTIAVIKTWQKNNGLVADGLVGAKTKAKMNAQ